MLPFVGKLVRQRSNGRFRDGVAAPIGTRFLATTVEREHNGRVDGCVEQANRRASEPHRRRDVDA